MFGFVFKFGFKYFMFEFIIDQQYFFIVLGKYDLFFGIFDLIIQVVGRMMVKNENSIGYLCFSYSKEEVLFLEIFLR